MKDSPAALAAVPQLVGAGGRSILSGATVVTSLDPVRSDTPTSTYWTDGSWPRAEASAGIAPAASSFPATSARTRTSTRRSRVACPTTLEPPADFLQILQRVWWRLDRALDEDTVRASALVGGMEALLSGTTTLVDHHASPNAIDGSLDVIEEALSSLGVRSVLCYETSDRDGPERAEAGIEENRRFPKRVRPGVAAADARRCRRARVVHALRRDARGLRCRARLESACTSTRRRTPSTSATRSCSGSVSPPAWRRRSARPAHAPRSRRPPRRPRARTRPRRERLAGPQRAVEHEQRDRPCAARRARASRRARHRRDRLRHVRGVADGVLPPPRGRSRAGTGWPLERLAEGARFVGAASASRSRKLEAGAPADLVVLDYAAPAPLHAGSFPGHWVFGLSSRHVRDVMVAGSGSCSTGGRSRRPAGAGGERARPGRPPLEAP